MTEVSTISDAIDRHLSSAEMRSRLPEFRASYARYDYVEIDEFMPADIWRHALDELEELFESRSQRRDVLIPQSANTPRRYSNVDRDSLAAGSVVIPEIFRSTALYQLLESIVGEQVLPVPYLPEEFIASRLSSAGDVHGWHWDDYTWALVWIFRMPAEQDGGQLEYVSRVPWNRDDPQIERLVARGPLVRRRPRVCSAYLLKADTALHRVAPLKRDAERMIVCYSFAAETDLAREVDHSSMAALYPQSHERHYG
ncbi:MAG TPA: hypothetical protein VK816_10105 [Jatrophihabitantaceae bacterium]|nr:hypothetical protein [Jatrophihabitantaceae bacterium]